jgi:hypothetical protein
VTQRPAEPALLVDECPEFDHGLSVMAVVGSGELLLGLLPRDRA